MEQIPVFRNKLTILDLEEGNDAVDLIFFQRSWILRNELLGKRVFLPLSFYSKRVTSSLDDKLNVDRIFHFSFDIIIIPGRGLEKNDNGG